MAPPTTIAGGSSGNLHACIDDSRSLGQHLASRLLQIGCDTVFGVPGDYNLIREFWGKIEEKVGKDTVIDSIHHPPPSFLS